MQSNKKDPIVTYNASSDHNMAFYNGTGSVPESKR